MRDHIPQRGTGDAGSAHSSVVLYWPRGDRLHALVVKIFASALVMAALAVPALAQSPSSSAPQNPVAPQSSPAPTEQIAAPVFIPSATTAPPEYQVGEGDVLGITVYNMPELNRNIVVGSEGSLILSYLPRPLTATGKTARQIGEEVASELKQLQVLIDPQVSVTVVQVNSKPVVVGGSVSRPQVLQEVRPLTLQQALMLAGGPETGSGNSVLVTRSGSNGDMVAYDLQLSKVLSGTDPKSNIPIKPGDTIQVLADQRVFVAGDVKNPGAFALGRGQRLTISKLMALTGGWKTDAKPSKAVIVREGSNGQRQTVPVDIPKVMARKQPDVTMEANDLLYIPSSTGKKLGLTVLKGVGTGAMVATGYLVIRH